MTRATASCDSSHVVVSVFSLVVQHKLAAGAPPIFQRIGDFEQPASCRSSITSTRCRCHHLSSHAHPFWFPAPAVTNSSSTPCSAMGSQAGGTVVPAPSFPAWISNEVSMFLTVGKWPICTGTSIVQKIVPSRVFRQSSILPVAPF